MIPQRCLCYHLFHYLVQLQRLVNHLSRRQIQWRIFKKTIRDKLYVNVTKYDTNWAEEGIVCGKIQYDSKAVTSNRNRHVKT